MKFSDGNWLLPEGMNILNPHHVHAVRVEERKAEVLALAVRGRGRADQINAPTLTLTLTAPIEGVIGVRIEHHRGAAKRGPVFELFSDEDFRPVIDDGDTALAFTSGGLTLTIPKDGTWRTEVTRGGKRLTGTGPRETGHASVAVEPPHVFERLDLEVGTLVYGLGERFSPFVKNGQSIDIWNEDGGTSTTQAYKNIPFFLTNRGWGLFVDDPGRVGFEVASEKVSKVQFAVTGEALQYYLIDGPTPKAVLDRYTRLTGRPALPPAWSFGLWLTTSFTTDYDEDTVNAFVDGMFERDIPLHVFHFDCFWMRGLHWCDFEWDPAVFPDPEGMLRRLRDKGLKICLWINPYIAQASKLFDEAAEKGYLVKRPDGGVWQWDLWQAGQAIVDFTNPEAADWYAGHLRRLIAMGVDAFKTDFGERIPTDVVWHDGSDPERMHNSYSFLYNRIVHDALVETRGESVLFARSATVGGQRFPVHWGGDCYSDYPAMAETLRGGLSLGLSGFGFWSHDIGGFENTAEADVYKRWCAFGLLSSHSRLHGSKSYRVPWLFDQEAEAVLRDFTRLKCSLMPYLYAAAVEASATGVPMLRAMLLEFPDDPGAETLDRQFMLGPSLLVAPVFDRDGEVTVYLPEGRWTQLLTGEVVDGPAWRRENHGVMSLPLYVRPNSLVAFGKDDSRPDYDYADGITFALYQLADGASATATVPDHRSGAPALKLTVRRDGDVLTATPDRDLPYALRLVGVPRIVAADGGDDFEQRSGGATLRAAGPLRITLPPA
ncbi:alpha-xylosidase [Pleomorphomonas koreensis]|uniref:alpha-xylosidase n=1 Tax=Pleomorphomonas koreensis TaxID=257440 RepID=UPI00041DEAB3|nr:alpha-xylosidase [Pleomorphomonas koreensis]